MITIKMKDAKLVSLREMEEGSFAIIRQQKDGTLCPSSLINLLVFKTVCGNIDSYGVQVFNSKLHIAQQDYHKYIVEPVDVEIVVKEKG